jgi:hypothetical protein
LLLGTAAGACSSTGSELFAPDGDAAPGTQPANGRDGSVAVDGADGTDAADGDLDPGDRDSGGKRDAGGRDATGDSSDSDAASDSGQGDSGADAGETGAADAGRDAATDFDAGSDADCGAPYKIFTSDAGPFCPFTATGPVNCPVTDHCCEYLSDSGLPSTCNAANAACIPSPGVVDWGCDEKNDCPSGEVCCFVGGITQDRSCPIYHGTNVTGTVCRPGVCNAGEKVICGKQADCTSGTCLGMNMRGKNLGFCGP